MPIPKVTPNPLTALNFYSFLQFGKNYIYIYNCLYVVHFWLWNLDASLWDLQGTENLKYLSPIHVKAPETESVL